MVRDQPMSEILLTVGISFMIADLALATWGGDPETLPVPDPSMEPLRSSASHIRFSGSSWWPQRFWSP
jgi:hypothetical protein